MGSSPGLVIFCSFFFPKRNKKLNKNVMNWRSRILPTVQQKTTNFRFPCIIEQCTVLQCQMTAKKKVQIKGQFSMFLSDRKAKINYIDVHCSVRPKFGFGMGNRNQGTISVSEPKKKFPKPKLLFSNFTHFFLLLGGIQVFISLKVNLALQK